MKKKNLKKLIQKEVENFEAEKLAKKRRSKIEIFDASLSVNREIINIININEIESIPMIGSMELSIEFRTPSESTDKQIYKGLKKKLKEIFKQ